MTHSSNKTLLESEEHFPRPRQDSHTPLPANGILAQFRISLTVSERKGTPTQMCFYTVTKMKNLWNQNFVVSAS